MRRISLALTMIVSVCIATATTHAATQSLHRSGLAGLLKQERTLGHVAAAHREGTSLLTPKARPNQTANTLFLPASAFSPATLNNSVGGVADVTYVDSNWFRGAHSVGYENFGFVTAAYQRADWSGTNPATYFRYQGSIMSSAANAANAWSDGVSYVAQQGGSGAASQRCNLPPAQQCSQQVWSVQDSNNNQYTEEYVALQYNQCLGEITADVPPASVSAVANQVDTTVSNIANAAVSAMAATCGSSGGNPTPVPTAKPTATPRPTTPSTQTKFSVVSVRFEKAGAKPDWNLKNNPVTQVKAGAKVQLSIYFNVASLAESSAVVTREYLLKLNGKKILDKTFNSGTISDLDTYRYSLDNVKLAKAGTYSLAVGVQIDGKAAAAQAKLAALQKYVAPKPVSFSLTNVALASSTIHAGQQARLNIGFRINNLKGTANALIARTVLANINGQWKGVSTNSSTTLVKNGQNTESVTTQLNAPGHFEIQIAVTVGASTQRKTVNVTVV